MNIRCILLIMLVIATQAVFAAEDNVGPIPQYFVEEYYRVTGDSSISQPFYGSCGTNWNDTFDVLVVDANRRPVVDAWITIRYQYSYTFGNKYTLTNPGRTDSNGRRNYRLQNNEPFEDKVDCHIEVYALRDKSIAGKKIIANNHENPVVLQLGTLYRLIFAAKDESGRLMAGVNVKVGNETLETDGQGIATFFVSEGEKEYTASYKETKVSGTMDITNDTVKYITFIRRSYAIELLDDQGMPLNGTITVFGKAYAVDNGLFFVNETWNNRIDYTAEYLGIRKSGEMDLLDINETTVVFDVHAPVFTAVDYTLMNDNQPRLTLTITDQGSYASGVDPTSITVRYTMGDATANSQWSTAQVFTSGKNVWIADFPEMQPNTLVSFRAEVADREGNKAAVDGKFTTTPAAPPQPPPSQPPSNQTQNGGGQPQEQGIPLLYIAGGIILVIVIVFLVFRLKSGSEGGV